MSSGLQDLFFNAAKKSGDRIAIEELSGNSISYSELENRVKEKSSFFSNHGINSGCRVVLMTPKSIDTVVLMLAILDCGATYIPIDPGTPTERLMQILRNLDPHAFIAHAGNFPSSIPCQQKLFSSVDENELSITFLNSAAKSPTEDLAFILYTSGSTGIPKGVCITHKNALAFTDWCLKTFPVNENDRFSSIASFHFDLSVFDLYVALACGGTVLLIDETTSRNARLLAEIISQKKIAVIYATPSLLSLLLNFGKIEKQNYPDLRIVLFAGEVFPVKHLHGLMKIWSAPRFFNLYGPTETNVCTWFEIPRAIDESRSEPYPIGKVCPQLKREISNEGELLISGPNVTPGYWQREDLNEKVFVKINGESFYKTGDRVEAEKDGNLIYIGRMDRMIKKRGYRIEPEEIETVLLRQEDVLEAAVIAGKDPDGYTLLRAFLALKPAAEKSTQIIREHCLKYLPSYMVPEQIHFSDSLPKSVNGKIDLKNLENLT